MNHDEIDADKLYNVRQKNVCDTCEMECDEIYETAEGNYECIDCHTREDYDEWDTNR